MLGESSAEWMPLREADGSSRPLSAAEIDSFLVQFAPLQHLHEIGALLRSTEKSNEEPAAEASTDDNNAEADHSSSHSLLPHTLAPMVVLRHLVDARLSFDSLNQLLLAVAALGGAASLLPHSHPLFLARCELQTGELELALATICIEMTTSGSEMSPFDEQQQTALQKLRTALVTTCTSPPPAQASIETSSS